MVSSNKIKKYIYQTSFMCLLDGDIWICKPVGLNQGKGIYLVRDIEEMKRTLAERDEKQRTQRPHRQGMGRLIQKYVK